MSKYLVLNSAKDDGLIVIYRPRWNLLTRSVISTIILHQCIYWWRASKEKPFYKFLNKCNHPKYAEGDSWCEELGLSTKEFSHGLKMIGFKKGKTKNLISKERAFIIYYRDNNGLTNYTINEDVLGPLLDSLYNNDNSLVNAFWAHTKKPPFGHIPLKTKINTKITIHKEEISSQSSEIPEALEKDPEKEILPNSEPLPPNPEPVKQTGEAVVSCAISPPHSTKNYHTMIYTTWMAKMGGKPNRKLDEMKALCEEHGLPTLEKAWRYYLASNEAKWVSIRSFCSKFGMWLKQSGGPILTQVEKDEKDAKLYQKPRDQTQD